MNTFYTANTYDDFDHYTEALTTWDLDLILLGPGKFHADMLFFGDTELQVREVYYNRLLLQRGTGSAAGYTLPCTIIAGITNEKGFWHMDNPGLGHDPISNLKSLSFLTAPTLNTYFHTNVHRTPQV